MIETALAVRIGLRSGLWRGWTGEATADLPISEDDMSGNPPPAPPAVTFGPYITPSSTRNFLRGDVTSHGPQRVQHAVTTTYRNRAYITTGASPNRHFEALGTRYDYRAVDTTAGTGVSLAGASAFSGSLRRVAAHDGRFYAYGRSGSFFNFNQFQGSQLSNAGPSIPDGRIDIDENIQNILSIGGNLFAFGYDGTVSQVNASTRALTVVANTTANGIVSVAPAPAETGAVWTLIRNSGLNTYTLGKMTVSPSAARYADIVTFPRPATTSQIQGITTETNVAGTATMWGADGYSSMTVPGSTPSPVSPNAYRAPSGLVSIDLPRSTVEESGSIRVSIAINEDDKHLWLAPQGPVEVVVSQLIRDRGDSTWTVMPHEWRGVLGETTVRDGLWTGTAIPVSKAPKKQIKRIKWSNLSQLQRTDGADTALSRLRGNNSPVRVPGRKAKPRGS